MVFLNVIAIYNSFLSKPITDSAKPWFHLPFSGLGGWKGVGGGGIKERFSVRWGFGCLKRTLNFYTPFSIHFAATYRY